MVDNNADWNPGRKKAPKEVSLDDVEPLHPDEYPAKKLKEILEHRREEMEERTHTLGMPDGPGPLT